MKYIKIFINADCSKETINAQDRNGKHWALFLDPEKYIISMFCSGIIDHRLKHKTNIKIIKLCNNERLKNRVINMFIILFHLLLGNYKILLNAKNSFREYLAIKWLKFIKSKKIIITFAVSQLPYGETNSIYCKMSDEILFNSHYLVANSHRVAETIYGYKSINVPVINNFYDLSLFTPIKHLNKRKKIICHGSMIAVKQPFLFANIAKEIPEADFYWYGERRYYLDMKRKAKDEGINNLYLPGKFLNSEIPELLAKGDIYLYPSIHDGFPSVLVEAMACGLPVITFDRYGPEAVIDGKTGYVVKSEFEILKKLRYLLNHEDFITEFGKNARKRACEYDGKKLAPKLEKIIGKILIDEDKNA